MTDKLVVLDNKEIENRIFTLRGVQVMLDSNLAEMYRVETKVLNQAVKRNIERFPASFRFQLTDLEYNECSRSQIVTLNTDNKNKKTDDIKLFAGSHDRFLVIDHKELYHLEASLKDLGKKWFAFSKMDSLTNDVLAKLK